MEYKIKYSSFLEAIENRICGYIPKSEPENLYEPFRYIMEEGGKRIRPVLTMIACGAVGGNPEHALDSGIALEILHNFTLAHDDIMDNSLIRRGKPTVHVKWNEAIAILTGDVMIGYAYKLLPKPHEHERCFEIFTNFTNELIEVCEGQVIDMNFNHQKDITIDDYMKMIDKKTARLIEVSAVIGANVGYGNEIQINAVRNIARYAGLAFQIQDDLLDMTAEQTNLGKKIGNDILEGKKTFMIITAKNKVNEQKDIDLINEFYEKNGLSESQIPDMDNLFKKYDVYSDTQKMVDELFEKSLSYFDKLDDNYYSGMLRWLILGLNKRNK